MPKMSPFIRGPQDVVSSSREAEASPRNEVCWMLGEVFLAFLGLNLAQRPVCQRRGVLKRLPADLQMGVLQAAPCVWPMHSGNGMGRSASRSWAHGHERLSDAVECQGGERLSCLCHAAAQPVPTGRSASRGGSPAARRSTSHRAPLALPAQRRAPVAPTVPAAVTAPVAPRLP